MQQPPVSHNSLNQSVLSFCIQWRSNVAKMHTAPQKMQYLCSERDPCLVTTDLKSVFFCAFFHPPCWATNKSRCWSDCQAFFEFDQHYFVPTSLFFSVIELTYAQSVTHCVEKSWLPICRTSSKNKINWPTGLSFHLGAHCFPSLHTMTCATSVYKSNVHCCRRNSACLFTFTVLMTLCIV